MPQILSHRVLGGRSLLLMSALTSILLVGWAVGMWWVDRWALGVAFETYLGPGTVLGNAAVGVVAFLFLASVTRRLLLSLLLVVGAHALLYLASSIKYRLLGMPVMLQDFFFLTSVDMESLQLFSGYVAFGWIGGAAVLGALVLLLALLRLEPCWCEPSARRRFAVMVTSAGLLVSLRLAVWPWDGAMYDVRALRPSPLSVLPAVLHGGLVSSLVHYNDQQRHRRLEVDADALRAAIRQMPARGRAAVSRIGPNIAKTAPDVVVVLSESFMDPSLLKGMQGLPEFIPNMRAALRDGHGGMMVAPTFGGGTVRTEFEVLTGMPVDAFQGVYYPYVDLSVGFMPGLVSELSQRGYASFALHGNAGSFWNRTSTYRAMGIERFITQRDMVKAGAVRDGGWISDHSMTDVLLAQLAKASRPTLAVAISIEGHGPYDAPVPVQDKAGWESIPLPPGLDEAASYQFRNYLYHLRNADRELGRLVDGLRARQRPFVLLFFGDHLPAFNGVYEKLGFLDGREAHQQPVPWLLVSNEPAMKVPPTAHAWELPGLVMDAAAASDVAWFWFVRQAGERVRSPRAPQDEELMSKGIRAAANARLAGSFDTYLDR